MPEQLALVPEPGPGRVPAGRRRRSAPASDQPLAEQDPVARVLVDTPLAHLDRPFEYLVPASLDEDARPGARVRVRFAGRNHDGILLSRAAGAEHTGRLAPLRSVVSPEAVLTPQVAAELRLVADHYGGTAADVLRLAVPPRHARAERTVAPAPALVPAPATGSDGPDPAAGGEGEDPSPLERADGPEKRADVSQEGADVSPEGADGSEDQPDGSEERTAGSDDQPDGSARPDPWAPYPAGPALLRRLAAGQTPGAAWLALPRQPPATDWTAAVTAAVRATGRSGRGSLVVVPDHRDVDRLLPVLQGAVGEDEVVRLTADLGPEARYRAFLRVLRGHARVVVGTRAAAFAPVQDLGLLVCWDEGDDLHQEPRAPYPHVREVLRLRAEHEGAALLLGGPTRSVAVQSWVEQGRVAAVEATRPAVRRAAPRVVVAGEGHAEARDRAARTARIPTLAWQVIKDGLARGPVLVQVPRQGYVVGLSCQHCRAPVRCATCHGPVGIGAGPSGGPGPAAVPACRWCGRRAGGGRCSACGSHRLRASAVGERRTAEELGRAFPGTRVISSGGEHVLAQVGPEASLVVATPGAEPWCPTGYAAAVLLDGWRLLERPSLDAQVEALRRWATAAALVAPGLEVGTTQVVLCGVPPHGAVPAVEALVRWAPAWLAARELAERRELGLPPVRRHAILTGAAVPVQEAVDALTGDGLELLGIVPDPGRDDLISATLREPGPSAAPGTGGISLPHAVHTVRAARSARKADERLRVVVDAVDPP